MELVLEFTSEGGIRARGWRSDWWVGAGSHSLQDIWGCKIKEENHTRGFWNFHYDGEPFLSYHPETRSWKIEPSSAQTLAIVPALNVTCGEAPEDTINMTCWAFGFYPQNISVTWLQDGEPRSQGTQQSWGVFPYVNGTYQTWVSIRIPQGQEQRFCCYVGYRGNNSTGLVFCGEPGHSCWSFQPEIVWQEFEDGKDTKIQLQPPR
uniref:MHC class I polypeptide-related sequence A-like n=1 Tax=Urocitellus parryii TaxID=9999 RepID=UPI000E55DD87|nr:MHC class I polypeptide-related sequence A-like [Urocitellus parryii]